MLNNVLKACVERFEQHQDVGLSLLKRFADSIKAVRLFYLHPPSLKA
jgi:hypothetical protein